MNAGARNSEPARRSRPWLWVAVAVLALLAVGVAVKWIMPEVGSKEMLRALISTDANLTILREQDGGFLVQNRSTGAYSVRTLDEAAKQVVVKPVDPPDGK